MLVNGSGTPLSKGGGYHAGGGEIMQENSEKKAIETSIHLGHLDWFSDKPIYILAINLVVSLTAK